MAKKEKVFPIDTFGGRVQYRRTNVAKLSRAEFYDLLRPNDKISRESKNRTVKNWESGQNEPDLATFQKMCALLKCSADYLLGFESAASADSQFIHHEIGLSEETVNQLHRFTAHDQGRIRLMIIDQLLKSPKFTPSLTDKLYDYYVKYNTYVSAEETYSKEREEIARLTGGDLIKEITLLKSGAFVQTMSRNKIAEYKDIADAARFKVQREFDDISEDLVKTFYHQKLPT